MGVPPLEEVMVVINFFINMSLIKENLKLISLSFCLTFNSFLLIAQTDSVIAAIKHEVDRNLKELRTDEFPSPFYISYTIVDLHHLEVKASFGSVIESSEFRERQGLPLVLVGSFQRNNLKYDFDISSRPQRVNIDNHMAGIKIAVWADLNREYKRAVQNYESKKGLLSQMQLSAEEQFIPDYEKTPLVHMILPPEKINIDKNFWEVFSRTASGIVKDYPEIIRSEVKTEIKKIMNYYYNTEGSICVYPSALCRISFTASVMSNNGMEISTGISFDRSSTDSLPDLKSFIIECDQSIANLLKRKNAIFANETYNGPVLFEGEELVMLFNYWLFSYQLNTPNLYLNRRNTFHDDLEMRMGETIISEHLTIKSLSGTKVYKEKILDGYYPVDGEGVKPAKELVLIENGVLKNMLSSRVPTLKNQQSNGHLRIIYNHNEIIRQKMPGILHISGSLKYRDDEMKQKLINAAIDAKLEYAYIVNDKGYIKIYVNDGREELIQGLIICRGDYKSLKKILGVSDKEFIISKALIVDGTLTTYIMPRSLLFEEFCLTKIDNIIQYSPPLIPKPTE